MFDFASMHFIRKRHNFRLPSITDAATLPFSPYPLAPIPLAFVFGGFPPPSLPSEQTGRPAPVVFSSLARDIFMSHDGYLFDLRRRRRRCPFAPKRERKRRLRDCEEEVENGMMREDRPREWLSLPNHMLANKRERERERE